jgi:hypothetical protein
VERVERFPVDSRHDDGANVDGPLLRGSTKGEAFIVIVQLGADVAVSKESGGFYVAQLDSPVCVQREFSRSERDADEATQNGEVGVESKGLVVCEYGYGLKLGDIELLDFALATDSDCFDLCGWPVSVNARFGRSYRVWYWTVPWCCLVLLQP